MTKGIAEVNACVICLESVSEEAFTLPCCHAFDYVCILSWLQLRTSCPLCKATVTHVEAFNESLGRITKHRIEQPAPPPEPTSSTSRQLPPRRRHYRPIPHVTSDTALLRRRHVYRERLRCLHVGSNRISRFRDFTPRMVREDEELQSRAKMFIRRELQVFEWTADNSEFLLEYLLAILKSVDLRASSGAAEDMLTDFLGRENSQIFLHEMHAFLRSPFLSLDQFDGFVQYEKELPKEFDERGMPVWSRRKRRAEEPGDAGRQGTRARRT